MEWSVRVIHYHGLRSRADLFPAAPTIAAFLTDLPGHVAAATQHQAMHALVWHDTRVLTHARPGRLTTVRADQQLTVPVVMTRDAVAAVIARMDGTDVQLWRSRASATST